MKLFLNKEVGFVQSFTRKTAKARLNLLFCRVVQLVFIRPRETLSNPLIFPKPLHASQQLLREWLSVFHSRHHIHHHLGVSFPVFVSKSNAQVGHSSEDGNQGLDGVTEDDWSILLKVFRSEAAFVDNPLKRFEFLQLVIILKKTV